MYSNWEECDDYSLGFEYCGNGTVIDYPITLGVDGFNVGERLNPANVSVYAGQVGEEFAWGDASYCGGYFTN
jgi:hypothetical protein